MPVRAAGGIIDDIADRPGRYAMSKVTAIPVGHYVDIAPVAGSPQRMHYHEAGPRDAREALVFLHGAGAGASGYSNFKTNYPVFADAGYRVVVPDLLGYGLSSKPDIAQYDLDFFVAGVKGLVDALGLERVSLVGNSLGGAVALGYALAHPQDVDKLVLLGPGGVEDIDTYLAMPGMAHMFAVYKSGKVGEEALREIFHAMLYDPSQLDEATIHERAPLAALQTKAARSILKVPNMTVRLGELRCPVFCIWGADDKFNPVGGAMKIAQGVPHARVEIVSHCGHWVQVEYRELFNRLCMDFLHHG